MNKTEKLIMYVCLLGVISLALYEVAFKDKKSDTVYVDMGKLLSDYQFKIELDKKAEAGVLQLKALADSLDLANKVAPGQGLDTQSAKVKYAMERYYTKASESINKQVFERLNPLFIEYGKEKKMKLILGAVGNGVILFGSDDRDITADLTKYVNDKYGSAK